MDTLTMLHSFERKIQMQPTNPLNYEDCFETIRLLEKDSPLSAQTKCKELRNWIRQTVASGELKTDGVIKMADIHKKTLLFNAQQDFDCFLQYLEINRPYNKRFYAPRRKTLAPMVRAFQDVADGKLDLLTVSQPKRTGKTSLGLLFVLFRAGRVPTSSSICSGAGNDLVKSFYTGCLDILQKPEEYLYYDIFPQARLVSTNADEKTIHLEKKKRFATITCRSIDGALTGSTEATRDGVMYLDDLVSDDVEANNRSRLDTLWDKVRGDLLGRRLEGCPIVAQGTRYSLYDPLGRLQDIADTMGWRTRILEIPAVDPITDKSNFEIEIDHKKMFTTEYYHRERELVSEMQWAAQFLQQPYEAKGLMFPADRLNRFFPTRTCPNCKSGIGLDDKICQHCGFNCTGVKQEMVAGKEPDAIVSVCDTAESGEDSVMMPIAYIYGEDVFIADCVFDNSAPDVTKPQCAKLLAEHKVSTAVFESNNAGEYYARDVGDLVKKLGGKVSIRTKRTISNKQTRIEFASDGIIKHFYFKDKSLYKPSDQYGQMMKELTTHTRSGKVRHDDAADGMSLLENEIRSLFLKNEVSVFKRPF